MEKRINILEFRSVVGSGGGPEKTILVGATKMDHARFNVVVAYMRNADDPAYTIDRRAQDLGVNFYDLPERCSLDPNSIARLWRIIAREKIDIVHAHDYKTDVFALILRPFLRFKLVSTAHGWITTSPKLHVYVMLDKLALRYCEKVMCVSSDIRNKLLRWGVRAERLIYLPNGVDTDHFSRKAPVASLRNELKINAVQPLIGAIGRLSEEKDLGAFLRVAQQVLRTIPTARFVLVGEGPHRPFLEQLARELGLDGRVLFLGQRNDILNVYTSLDLLLLTSSTEGFPNVVLEAMAMELPVVATDVGGVSDLLEDGITGRVVARGDIDGLARAVADLMKDREFAHRLAKAARERVCREFSFEGRVRKLERVYLDVMGKQGTGAVLPAVSTPAS